jgi:predicted Zn-dependent protease with MMP-like domain
MDDEEFAAMIAEAVQSLPQEFHDTMENVEIVTSDFPTKAELREAGIGSDKLLLGLYQGIPLTGRNLGYNLVLPDKITIFKEPILTLCQNRDEVIALVRKTIIHEIAHHFGISDERLRQLGAY